MELTKIPVHRIIMAVLFTGLFGVLIYSVYVDYKKETVHGTRTSILYDSIGNNIFRKEWDVSWKNGSPTVLEDLRYKNLTPGETYTYQVETTLEGETVSVITGTFTAQKETCRISVTSMYN